MTLRVVASLLAFSFLVVSPCAGAVRRDLLGPEYPLDVEISRIAGLFHWVDSLADTSAGKTVPAHRDEFVRRWGRPDRADSALLLKFRRARLAHLAATKDSTGLLGIFCAASSIEAGVAAARKDLKPDEASDLAAALNGLAPKFDVVWDGGSVPRAFLERVVRAPRREELAGLLARVASFFGVDPGSEPPPRLILVPVPAGWGTHAQAVGRQLLLEIRAGDDLAQQAAVIVHENAHFLFEAMPEERRARLAGEAKSLSGDGETAWRVLQEALPTAFGQGVADRMFRPSDWSRRNPWYHTAEVDAYAKSLHAIANHVISAGGRFDEDFLRHVVQIWVDGGHRRGPEILDMEP